MAYDFTTLSPDDFEALVADLLSREWGAQVEIFKTGKDGGVDVRHSRLAAQSSTIVQCKRYAPHKVQALLRNLQKEVLKLSQLRPPRFVLATSVGLSPANKEEILRILTPWCTSTGDIYGLDELNALLRLHPDVERAHFKLWITSSAVLERILHARIFALTQETIDATKEQLSRLVVHAGFGRALDILRDQHYVLILGNPGIGKTTLARMLMCRYLTEGFLPICVSGTVEDAWNVVDRASAGREPIVVLYDDFLGRLQFDSQRFGKNEEHSLIQFLHKVRRSGNLRFILTTREYILADAQRMYGAFASHGDEIVKCTLSLADYTKSNRARMLFNHLYFSDLPDSRLQRLVESRAYQKIVAHEHFNPRIVESISNYANSRAMPDAQYLAFVETEFRDPSKVWDHAFRRDISPMGRQLLTVLWSFGGTAELSMLRAAVLKMQNQRNIEQYTIAFTDTLRQLDGNFITTNKYPGRFESEGQFLVVQFQNPSVEEFVSSFVASELDWLEPITRSVMSFGQVQKLASEMGNSRFSPPDNSVWVYLRNAAVLAETKSSGNLINYTPYRSQSRRTWDVEEEMAATRTHILLRIEARVRLDDDRAEDLRARVLTRDGWTNLLYGVANDDGIAYAVERLQQWIVKESGWESDEKEQSQRMLRSAIVSTLSNADEAWPITPTALRILAEMASSFGPPLSVDERQAYASAAREALDTLNQNEENYDLFAEAEELEKLEVICAESLGSGGLRNRAEDLQAREPRRSSYSETNQLTSEAEELDVDLLFSGLLER